MNPIASPYPAGLAVSRRTLLIGAGVTLGSTLLGGCGTSTTGASNGGRPHAGGSLRACIASDPDTLDPQKSSLAASAEIYDGIFDRLVELRPDGRFTPSLATEWPTPDDRTYVFTLREGVTFHNGDPLTADDVVFTFRRIIDKSFGSSYAEYFDKVEHVEKNGKYQVTFHLSRPYAPLLANLANRGNILSKRAVDSGDVGRSPIGTGPFVFEKWIHGQSVQLRRNEKYFVRNRPYLEEVNFRYLTNSQSRVLALQSDQVDWADAIPYQSIKQVKRNASLRYVTSGFAGKPEFLLLNTTKPPLNNKALRQAICWAIDRDEIAKVAFLGAVAPGAQEFGKSSPWYSQDYPYADAPKPERVRSLLKDAGHPDGGVTVKFLAWTSGPDAVATGQVLQQQLKPYGINLEIEQVEISVWLNREVKKDFEMTLAFQEQMVDPDNFWARWFKSGVAHNVTGYRSKTADRLMDEAAATADHASRKKLYDQVRNQVLDDAPMLFTAYIPLGYAARSDVKGIGMTPMQDPRFSTMWLDD